MVVRILFGWFLAVISSGSGSGNVGESSLGKVTWMKENAAVNMEMRPLNDNSCLVEW